LLENVLPLANSSSDQAELSLYFPSLLRKLSQMTYSADASGQQADARPTAPPPEISGRMFEIMALAKAADGRLRKGIAAGESLATYWPSRGQEAIAGALGVSLGVNDYMVTTYRGMHDQIAKGVPLVEIFGEGMGRVVGAGGGKGGTMHIAKPEVGLMMTTGIVGAGIPIGTGLALAAKLLNEDRITVVCFGDGATNQGAFHEGVNLAAVWSLPVVFVCQNNLYGEMTPITATTRVTRIADHADAYGIPGVHVNGNDPVAVYEGLQNAMARARKDDGPTLLECETFRFYGHYYGDQSDYMSNGELAAARDNDPVVHYRNRLIESGAFSVGELVAIERTAEDEANEAFQAALDSPLASRDVIAQNVYSASTVLELG
jgi:acetoin:2,6-dichlorophenolindophenol oxidoreductase subunit alpha